MNCTLPRARARPVGMLMLLLILVRQTTSSNVALQRSEEDEDGKVVKESQLRLRKKPHLVKAEAKEEKASSTSALQAHAQSLEGDTSFFGFEIEPEQEVQMTKRHLSIFDAEATTTEEAANIENETAGVVVVVGDGEGVYCNDTVDKCNLDVDLAKDCDWIADEEAKTLTCFITMDDEDANDPSTLDYEDNPLLYPDVTYDYENVKDEDEEKSSKSGKQDGTGRNLADDESGRKLKRRKQHEYESGSDQVISVITEPEREQALQLIDQASKALDSAENLWQPTRESCQVQIDEVRAEVANPSSGLTKNELNGTMTFLGDVVKNIGDLASGDDNKMFQASLKITASAALLTLSPPIGTVFSKLLLFGAKLSPFPTSPTESMEDVLVRVLEEKFAAFSDHLLQTELSTVQGDLKQFSQRVNFYGSRPSEISLRAERGPIITLFENNKFDTSYSFLKSMGDNFISRTNATVAPLWQSDPEQMGNRIISFYQVARDRINLCNRIAGIFARLGNADTTNMTEEEMAQVENDRDRSVFWGIGQVAATRELARDYLSFLTIRPSDVSSGTSPVLKALHQLQSREDWERFEEFIQEELGMTIPGTLLQIRNLSYDQYMDVSKGPCPSQANLSSGFKKNHDCPYVETTPGPAGAGPTDWNKIFRVYGNRKSFRLWNVGQGAYIRMRDSFMPTYRNNGRARHHDYWDRWPTSSRLPLKWQIEFPAKSKSDWEFDFEPFLFSNFIKNLPGYLLKRAPFYQSQNDCNKFTVGPRKFATGVGTGDTLFAQCRWGLFGWGRPDLPDLGTVEWSIYSTSWGTEKKNGNNRNRNQVLMWTQQDKKCCVASGRGDTVTQGIWQFVTLDGSVFRLPASGFL